MHLLCLLFLVGSVTSQAINPNSLFCAKFQISTAPAAVKTKYKTLLTNLAKDKTLAAQQTRAKNWLNTNAAAAGIKKDDLTWVLPNVAKMVESRWRIVAFFKGLLAKIKPKLATSKFDELRKLLWKMDADAKNNVMYMYGDWKTKAIGLIADATKKETVKKIFYDFEVADSKKSNNFGSDQMEWMAPPGFTGCNV